MRKFIFLISIFFTALIFSQEEFNAIVTVNSDKVQSSDKQLFENIQKSLSEFINRKKWTDRKFRTKERINCAFTIIISEQNGNNFKGSLQVQSTRPTFGSTYDTPILNINDQDFSFSYTQFQSLNFNPNIFENNLISTIVFYVYTVLGVDADTFALKGGEQYFKKAENVMRQAQQSGGSSWQDKIGVQNRYALIDGFTSAKFETLRKVYYEYHRKGLDLFATDETKAKNQLANSILDLKKIHNITVGNYMLRIFIDAKTNEIVNVFSGGKSIQKNSKVRDVLDKIAPTQSSLWAKIN